MTPLRLEDYLAPGERISFVTRPSYHTLWTPALWAVLLTGLGILSGDSRLRIVPLLFSLGPMYRFAVVAARTRRSALVLTSTRVIYVSSLWSTEVRSLLTSHITSVEVRQGPVQQLAGIWTLRIETSSATPEDEKDAGDNDLEIDGLREALAFRDALLNLPAQPSPARPPPVPHEVPA